MAIVRIRATVIFSLLVTFLLLPLLSNERRGSIPCQLCENRDVTSFSEITSNEDLSVMLTCSENDLDSSGTITSFGLKGVDLLHAWGEDQERLLTASDGKDVIQSVDASVENGLQPSEMPVPKALNDVKSIISNILCRLLKSIPFDERQNSAGCPCSSFVPGCGGEEVSEGHVTLHAFMTLSTSSLVSPSTCRNSVEMTDGNVDHDPKRHCPSPPLDTTIFLQFHFISVLCHPQPQTVEPCSEHEAVSTMKLNSTEPELLEMSGEPAEERFTEYPFWSSLFSFKACEAESPEEQQQTVHTDVATFALNLVVREILFSLMVLMTIIYRQLPRLFRADKTKHDDNSVYLKVLTKSFFLKWTWPEVDNIKPAKHDSDQDSSSVWRWKRSPLDALNSFIFRPWLRKASSTQCQLCPRECCWSTSPLCSSCRHYVDNFITNPSHTFDVYPAFLPDPTRNPSIDMAHVGYRLATLGALASSFPVWKMRLADAGFYFRGHEDEMTCYRCGVRHSGWRTGDNPMDIHRQLSPACPHVLQRDQESTSIATATGSGQSIPNSGQAVSNGHPSQTPTVPRQHTPDTSHASCNGHTPRTQSRGVNDPAEETRLPHSPEEDSEDSGSERGEGSPANGRVSAGSTRRGHDPSNSSPIHGSAVPSGSAGSSTAAGVHAQSRHLEEGQRGSGALSVTRHTTGSEGRPSSDDLRTSQLSSPTPTTFNGSRMTAVPPSDSQAEAEAARAADSRRLFPTARLDLGGAVYPMYQTMTSRRQTFTRWDDTQAPPLEEVLLSGMFYAGYADCVRCFYCGVGLKNWVGTDNVWDEHVRWRPECGYLWTVKGERFVRDTQRRLDTEGSPNAQGQGNGNGSSPNSRPGQRQQPSSSSSSFSSSSSAAATGAAAGAATCGATSSSSSSLRNVPGDQEAEERNNGQGVVVSNAAAGSGERASRLQAVNEELNRRLHCSVCRQSPVDTIFMPCGHLVMCESCAGSVTSCPLCQSRIVATAKVHFG